MICKSCKRETPDYSIFCCWCGVKLLQDKTEVKVPAPKILPSGSYFGRLMVMGERINITAATEKEYYTKARAAKTGLIEAKKAAPKITVGAAIDKYIEDNSNILSPSTITAYKSYRRNRMQEAMNKAIDADINWQRIINDDAKKVSAKTVNNAWRLVTAALSAQNVTPPNVNLPQVPKSSRPWLDYEQIKVFLEAVEGKPCETVALLALHSLRRSEIFALSKDKIDLKKDNIIVSGAVVWNDEHKLVQKAANKNRTSTRTIPIMIPRLKTLLISADGVFLPDNINSPYKQINAVCKASGLPEVGVHGLRHSFASLAYHLGWSEATTMQIGGWSESKTVHDIYTHLAAQDRNADINKMLEFYSTSPQN